MTNKEDIKKQARSLAEENRKADPAIEKVYWFPDGGEVRLVELSEEVPESEDGVLHPFYFQCSPQDNLPAPSGIAIIRPEEFRKLEMPDGWFEKHGWTAGTVVRGLPK